jgi:thymidylate synthase ThyX
LLIHRELSHRRRLTAKWEIQEYAEAQWREIRKGAADSAADSSKVILNSG